MTIHDHIKCMTLIFRPSWTSCFKMTFTSSFEPSFSFLPGYTQKVNWMHYKLLPIKSPKSTNPKPSLNVLLFPCFLLSVNVYLSNAKTAVISGEHSDLTMSLNEKASIIFRSNRFYSLDPGFCCPARFRVCCRPRDWDRTPISVWFSFYLKHYLTTEGCPLGSFSFSFMFSHSII